ncbi:hypothetical protein D9758_002505 [Tetrapyrgos nigripes]|uniref:Rad60/SUMO-like domain-containing protein n=1 Tax=Tetrapyrgos nigripes TaxID=182062 RepID=A0A8H5GQW0_9AGAR|nr:hypothetical protein D9758_002505 [Tetrapyrgos nigripes]
MSSAASQPRPRPRPKPKPKAASGSGNVNVSSDGNGPSPTPVSASTYEIQDSDEMFMRNKTRNRDAWAQLEKLDREKEAKGKRVVSESEDDSDQEKTPQRKSKGKKAEKSALPIWERDKKFKRFLSQDKSDSDDSDDSITILDDNKTPNAKNLKRKRGSRRKQSRSRSITPPPQVSEQQLKIAREQIRKVLGVTRATTSPETEDNEFKLDDSPEKLDPELAAYAQRHAAKAQAHAHRGSSTGPEDKVTIRVKWQPHPNNSSKSATVSEFRLDRSDDFSSLFEAVAEEAEVLPDNVVMTYRGTRVFPSVTPEGRKIWGQADFDACDKSTYEYLRQQEAAARYTQPPPNPKPKLQPKSSSWTKDGDSSDVIVLGSDDEDDDDDDDIQIASPPEQAPAMTPAAPEEDTGDKFKLVLRSGKTSKDITLTVRPTTKCGAIVKAFLKKATLADASEYADFIEGGETSSAKPAAKKPRKSLKKSTTTAEQKTPSLCVDGERVGNDTEIGDQDLEDGDMIEVVGL